MTSRSFSRHPILRRELLERYPQARFNDAGESLAGDGLIAFLQGADRAITALEQIDERILARVPELKLISKVGVGTDMLDLDALERHGVKLIVTPGTNARSVSELVVMMSIALLRRVPEQIARLVQGDWGQMKGATLSGRTVGVVGFGHVGRDVASLLAPFGCSILAYDIADFRDWPSDVRPASLEELLGASDIVSLHVALTAATRELIDADRISQMKHGAILINTARGELVSASALESALRSGLLAAAGLDVFECEPPFGSALLTLPNVLATPHIGGSTEEAILAMGRAAIEGLADV